MIDPKTPTPFKKYIDNFRFVNKEDSQSPIFPIDKDYATSYSATDVVDSAMRRYNYNWAYWVQFMVLLGNYNSDSIPVPDYEYLRGLPNAEKMTNFKEIIIRSDIDTRKQFENNLVNWTYNADALDNKHPVQRFYMGFLSQHYLINEYGVDGFPGAVELVQHLYNEIPFTSATPKHPNYVVCLVPYTKEDSVGRIIPDLANRYGKMRYTNIQGYSESKQFYSPDYSNLKPTNNKDYRRTLLWNPIIEIEEGGKAKVEFYNSYSCRDLTIDITGRNGQLYFSNNPFIVTNTNEEHEHVVENKEENDSNKEDVKNSITPEEEKIYREHYNKGAEYFNKKNYKNAVIVWAELAKYKYPPALHRIAECYLSGTGVAKNDKAAKKFFEDAAKQGKAESQYSLSKMYREGVGCDANIELADKWLGEATKQKEPHAMAETAIKLIETGERENIEKGKELLAESARKECATGLYEYGMYIINNPGGIKDEDENSGINYIRAAAGKGLQSAQIFMMRHENSTQNYKEAYKWARELSQAKNHEATKLMGDYYLEGKGIKKDKRLAKDLYRKAVSEGNKEAEAILKNL